MQVPLELVLVVTPHYSSNEVVRRARTLLDRELLSGNNPSLRLAEVPRRWECPGEDFGATTKCLFVVDELETAQRTAATAAAATNAEGRGDETTRDDSTRLRSFVATSSGGSRRMSDDSGGGGGGHSGGHVGGPDRLDEGVNNRDNSTAGGAYTLPYWALLVIARDHDTVTPATTASCASYQYGMPMAFGGGGLPGAFGQGSPPPLPPQPLQIPTATIPSPSSASAWPGASVRGGSRGVSMDWTPPLGPQRTLVLNVEVTLHHPEGSAVAANRNTVVKGLTKVNGTGGTLFRTCTDALSLTSCARTTVEL